MNEEEYGVVLRQLRRRTRQSGRADLDDRIMQSRLAEPRSPSSSVLEYLYGLRDDLALGSEAAIRETMERFRGFSTESGGVIEGIVIDVLPQDRAALGVDQVDLVGSPRRDEILADLDRLIARLEEDEERT